MIRQWVVTNRTIDTHVAVSYLTSAVAKFGLNFFKKKIEVPTWSMLTKIYKTMNWGSFLEKPENLFNEAFIDEKLKTISSRRQLAKTIKALNKLASNFRGMIKIR